MGRMQAKGAAIAAFAVLLCGACSSSPKTTSSVVAPLVTNSSEAAKVSDEARARAIVLADADFPSGWQGSAHTEDATDREFERKLKACSGITQTKGTADVFGDDIDQGQASVGSEATFFKTAAAAHADLGTVNNPRALPCVRSILTDLLKAALKNQGVTGAQVSGVSLVRVPVARYGDESAGLRLTATISGAGQSLPFFQDMIVARKGRVEVTASFFNAGGAFPAALKRTLIGTLVARLIKDGGQ